MPVVVRRLGRRLDRARVRLAGVAMNPQDRDGPADVQIQQNGVTEPATLDATGATDAPQPGMIRRYTPGGKPTRVVLNPESHPKPMVFSRQARLATARAIVKAHPTRSEAALVEELAEAIHNIWMGWAVHVQERVDAATRRRWRPMFRPYRDLPEAEKAKDRVEAWQLLDSVREHPLRRSRPAAPDQGHWVTMHGTHVYIAADGTPRWPDATGWHAHQPDQALPAHMGSLRIPPAWTAVRVNPDPAASLWVTGRDSAGRTQRVYAPAFAATNAAAKFARIQALDAEWNHLGQQIAQAQRAAEPRTRDSADCLALIRATGIRPGSTRETHAKVQAYGATTLEGRHVTRAADGTVTLRYVGKKGVALTIPVTDRAVARMLVARAKAAGPDGRLFPATDHGRLLAFTHGLDTGRFKPKDFRTYVGTAAAQAAIAARPAPTSPTAYARAVREVARTVAGVLGNTPQVALASYIAPQVFADWRATAHV
jgi:DNA topoisomerase IB